MSSDFISSDTSTEDKLSAEVSEDMKIELIQEIKNAVEARDIDEVDDLVEKLAGCMSGQREKELFVELQDSTLDLEWTRAENILDQLQRR